MVLCAVASLVQSLGIMPASTASVPMMDYKGEFNMFTNPGEGFSDPMMATYGLNFNAALGAIGAIVTAPYVIGWMTNYGIDMTIAMAVQGLIVALLGLDIFYVVTGKSIL